MKRLVSMMCASAAALSIAGATAASAAEIPCETAKLIVPWGAGGDTHVIFSVFEKKIQELDIKPKIQVVTMGGQGGNKGAKEAHGSAPDGCTLFAIHQSAITSYLNGRIDFQYDGFETVARLTSTPDVPGANPNTGYKTWADVEAAAKAAPGSIKVGATFGSTSQFMWLLLEDLTGVQFSYVPYDGTAERVTALLSGAIDLGSVNIASNRALMEAGEVVGLGIAAANRSKHMPDMPTMKEQGVDLEYSLVRGIVAPKGTPKDIIDMWAGVFQAAAEDPGLLAEMDAKGTDVEFVGPEGFREWAEKTYAAYEKVAIKIGMYKK
ncbi:MAG TPA: tripartite tricarboxylate transporter substrate binding protein [Thermohalobaculum sp.]|nr:tripartite tricarboxylate transporter substrate binding protein [Thermohalobaculum sp.]